MYILNMNNIHLAKQLPASTLERREFVNHLATSKENILAASRELIKESGWTAVSIRAVASRCSVSAGTIYNYYESKADLLGDTIESIWREIFFRSEDEQVFKDVAACVSWIYKRLEYGNAPIFKFSPDVRKVIYTTNAIESLNSTYRKLNRQRSVFPSDTALLKALYLATFEATKKWTMSIRNWGRVYGELSIMYEGRLPE